MASKYPDCVRQLLGNSNEEFSKAANLLLRIARNIENNPGVEKYRSIQIGGKTFMESLLPVDGAVQCLLEMGFEEAGERFKYLKADHADLRNMKAILEMAIQDKRSFKPQSPAALLDVASLQKSEGQTYSKLLGHFEHVLVYENAALQAKARSVIPLEKLSKKANDKLSDNPQITSGAGTVSLDYDDCVILALLEWFKFEFFKWVDSPACSGCAESKCTMAAMLPPTDEDRKWGASRVEGHRCGNCGTMVRFPRYNNPEKLLETRQGRCGEWADCFTLLCRSLGYDARHVLDLTDHVWTEVYSKSGRRWVHCDPCENAFDKPLLYEKGWGKKLSLLVATSCDEIVDVSRRYSDDWDSMRQRRASLFREEWLENALQNMNAQRQRFFTPSQKSLLESRKRSEIVELISPKVESRMTYGGRTTGSVEWRTARGELGAGAVKDCAKSLCPRRYSGPGDEEFTLEYFSKSDEYRCSLEVDRSGWDSVVYAKSSVRRKEELDWKMAYLARAESADEGFVCWKFDLKHLDERVVVKRCHVKVESTVYESGSVKWLLCTDKNTVPLTNCKISSFEEEVKGARTVSIHAFLRGGTGDVAWQHTQLFRTSTQPGKDEPQFVVRIKYGLR